uniref:Uncharacterized protein n=1 Tax=Sinocyclocheilus grahami TaxID=75366 RepID=A0A672REH4_SINGR
EVTLLEDAVLNQLFWLGANYHRSVDLPDITGLTWREGVFRCLGSAGPGATTNPPPSAASPSQPAVNVASRKDINVAAPCKRYPVPQLSPGRLSPGRAPVPRLSPGRAPDPRLSPGRAPDPQLSPGRDAVPQSSSGRAPVPQSSPGRAPVPQSKPGRAPVPQSSPGRAPDPQFSPGRAPVSPLNFPKYFFGGGVKYGSSRRGGGWGRGLEGCSAMASRVPCTTLASRVPCSAMASRGS